MLSMQTTKRWLFHWHNLSHKWSWQPGTCFRHL